MPPKNKRAKASASFSHAPPPQEEEPTDYDSYDPRYFVSSEAAKRHLKIRRRPPIPERGFQVPDSFEPLGRLINDNIAARRWTTFAEHPASGSVTAWVAEFYANLPEAQNGMVMVRGKRVPCTSAAINAHYRTPSSTGANDYFRWLAGEKDEAAILRAIARPGVTWHTTPHGLQQLKRANFTRHAKAWLYFLGARLFPIAHFRHVDRHRINLLYGLVAGLSLNVGAWISMRMSTVHSEKHRAGLPFPILVTDLCLEAGVPVVGIEIAVPPKTPIDETNIKSYKSEDESDEEEQDPAPPPPPPDMSDYVARGMHYLLSRAHYAAEREHEMHAVLVQHTAAMNEFFARSNTNGEAPIRLDPLPPYQPFQYHEPTEWPPQLPQL